MKTSQTISKSFLGFLLASFLIWVLITFSKEYKTVINYEVNFINIPQKNILLETTPQKIALYVNGSGFRLFWSQLFDETISLDVSKFTQQSKGNTYILPKNQLSTIQEQVMSGVTIESILKDTLFVKMGFLKSKKVPLKPNLNINYQVGYKLLGNVTVSPDSVVISGAEKQLKKIEFLELESLKLSNVKTDFSTNVAIVKPSKNIKLTTSKAVISAKVDKFTEGNLQVPFKIVNLPSDIKITTLSETVLVTFVVALSQFSRVSEASFVIECDYEMSTKNELGYLIPKIVLKPDFVENIKVIPTKIDYLIQK
ncbi:MAG: YbbR-like domain-containing protein [Polaribacter sp.]|nr:YbbR-like domain-containing protein [Polaribacter sp.]